MREEAGKCEDGRSRKQKLHDDDGQTETQARSIAEYIEKTQAM
jgi:hypothetical protein